MLLCFGFYKAAAYRAGCRTFGWECLGNYACTAQPTGSLPFGYVRVYAVDGSDPAEALRAAEVAPGALGFAELVAESQAFMTGHVGHAGWLGQFKVDGVVDAKQAEVCVHGSDDDGGAHVGRTWLPLPDSIRSGHRPGKSG